jgi:hypothetical protein
LKEAVSAMPAKTNQNVKPVHSKTKERRNTMEEYLYGISDEHKKQLDDYAKKHGVSAKVAIRNIVSYLKGANFKAGMPDYMAEMVTGARIEGVIDMIVK